MRTALYKHQCCVTTFYVTPPKFKLVYEWLSVTRTMMDHGCQSPELWGIMAVNHQTTRIPQITFSAKVCLQVTKAAKSAHELKNSN